MEIKRKHEMGLHGEPKSKLATQVKGQKGVYHFLWALDSIALSPSPTSFKSMAPPSSYRTWTLFSKQESSPRGLCFFLFLCDLESSPFCCKAILLYCFPLPPLFVFLVAFNEDGRFYWNVQSREGRKDGWLNARKGHVRGTIHASGRGVGWLGMQA